MNPEPKDFAEYKTDHDLLIELRTVVLGLRDDFKDAKASYVTEAEFWPVKMLAYGFAGLLLTGMVGAIIALVLK